MVFDYMGKEESYPQWATSPYKILKGDLCAAKGII